MSFSQPKHLPFSLSPLVVNMCAMGVFWSLLIQACISYFRGIVIPISPCLCHL